MVTQRHLLIVLLAAGFLLTSQASAIFVDEGGLGTPDISSYDLSTYTTEMNTVFGAAANLNIAAEPLITNGTCTVTAGSTSSLRACLNSGPGRRIIVPAGTYDDGGTWSMNSDNVLLEMDDAAFIEGSFSITNVARVKVLGGNIVSDDDLAGDTTQAQINNEQKFNTNNFVDLTLENVNIAYDSTPNAGINFCTVFGSGTCDRLSIINSSLYANRGTAFWQRNTSDNYHEDTLIVGSYLYSDYVWRDDGRATVNDEQTLRVMTTDRFMLVDSYIEHGSEAPKALWRQHYGNEETLVIDNTFCSRYAPTSANSFMLWIDTTAGSTEENAINDSYFYDNNLYDLNGNPGLAAPFTLDDSFVFGGSGYVAGADINNVVFGGTNNYYSSDDRVFSVNFNQNLTSPGPVTYTGTFGGGVLPTPSCPVVTKGSDHPLVDRPASR